MIISMHAEKDFEKTQHPFTIKNYPDSGHRRSLSQYNKGHIWTPIASIILNGWKPESIPFKISNKKSMSTPATFIQHSFGSPKHINHVFSWDGKEIKGIELDKKYNCHCLHMMWYST